MSQKTQEFYTALLSKLKDIHSRPEHYKQEFLHARYRVATESELYSVAIPASSFGTQTTEILIEQFEKNYSEDLPEKIEAYLESNLWNPVDLLLENAPSWDLKKPETPTSIEILQSIVLDEWEPYFLALFEYRAPDGSLLYVFFNKQGVELARTNPEFEPYPLSGADVDLIKVHILPNEKTEYDSSFPDLRYRP